MKRRLIGGHREEHVVSVLSQVCVTSGRLPKVANPTYQYGMQVGHYSLSAILTVCCILSHPSGISGRLIFRHNTLFC